MRVFGANDRTKGSADVGEPVVGVGPDAQVVLEKNPTWFRCCSAGWDAAAVAERSHLRARCPAIRATGHRVGVLDLWDAVVADSPARANSNSMTWDRIAK